MPDSNAIIAPSRARAIVGVADQLLYSLTNFLLAITVAHFSSASDFGAFTILVATFLIASGVNRGLTGEPLVINYSVSDRAQWRVAANRKIGHALLFGAGCGLVTAISCCVIEPARFAQIGIVFAIAMPILFAQDFLRYAALAAGRPGLALLNDSAAAVVQIGLTVSLILLGDTTSSALVAAWVAAGIAGGLIGARALGVRPTRGSDTSTDEQLARRLGLDNLATQAQQQGTGYIVAICSGLSATAGLRAAQTVFTPPSILSIGVLSASMPEFVRLRRRSLTDMRRALGRTAGGLATMGVAFAVGALVLPDTIAADIFGKSWNHAAVFVPYLAAAQVAGMLSNTAAAGLRVLGQSRLVLRARGICLLVALVPVIPATTLYGPRGAAISIACTGLVQLLVWWTAFRRGFAVARRETAVRRVRERWALLVDSDEASLAENGFTLSL